MRYYNNGFNRPPFRPRRRSGFMFFGPGWIIFMIIAFFPRHGFVFGGMSLLGLSILVGALVLIAMAAFASKSMFYGNHSAPTMERPPVPTYQPPVYHQPSEQPKSDTYQSYQEGYQADVNPYSEQAAYRGPQTVEELSGSAYEHSTNETRPKSEYEQPQTQYPQEQ